MVVVLVLAVVVVVVVVVVVAVVVVVTAVYPASHRNLLPSKQHKVGSPYPCSS